MGEITTNVLAFSVLSVPVKDKHSSPIIIVILPYTRLVIMRGEVKINFPNLFPSK